MKDSQDNRNDQENKPRDMDSMLRDMIDQYIKSAFPESPDYPAYQIYQESRKKYLEFPRLEQCTRENFIYESQNGWKMDLSYLKEIDQGILASLFDHQLSISKEDMIARSNEFKATAKGRGFTDEQIAQMFAGEYEYNMSLCLNHAFKHYTEIQTRMFSLLWIFCCDALVLKTLQDLRETVRWIRPPAFGGIRNTIYWTAENLFNQIVGESPRGPSPDYLGFTFRASEAINSLMRKGNKSKSKIRLTQSNLAEEMGITEGALKKQLKKYRINWKKVLADYKERKGY